MEKENNLEKMFGMQILQPPESELSEDPLLLLLLW